LCLYLFLILLDVVFVVKAVKVHETTYYKVAIVAKEGVPHFGPPIPSNALFKRGSKFRNFFYAKCKSFSYYGN